MNRYLLVLGSTLLITLAFSSGQAAPSARAAATNYPCQCLISTIDLSMTTSTGSSNIIDNVPLPNQPGHNQCKSACAAATSAKAYTQAIATAACAAGAPNGRTISAFSKTSGALPPPGPPWLNTYTPAASMGVLVRAPGSTKVEWRCPPAWTSNTDNTLGGVTTDGRCKRIVGIITTGPNPPDGSQLQAAAPAGSPVTTWGFSWGNRILAYGTAANGGAPVKMTIVTPPVCRLS